MIGLLFVISDVLENVSVIGLLFVISDVLENVFCDRFVCLCSVIGLLFVISDVLENVFCDRFVICNIRCSGKCVL